jgi:GNAT superfamily N-acetyltransferase
MEVVDLPQGAAEAYVDVVDGEEDPFDDGDLDMAWRPKTAFVGLREGDRLIGVAGWVGVEARLGPGPTVPSVGLGGVILHRSFRSSGRGAVLVSGAMERMRALGVPMGLLFCGPERVRFYRSLGWEVVPGTVTADQPTGVIEMPFVTCWTPLVEGTPPPGPGLHVQGLPF